MVLHSKQRTWDAVFTEGNCEGYLSRMRHWGHWVCMCDTTGHDSRISDGLSTRDDHIGFLLILGGAEMETHDGWDE